MKTSSFIPSLVIHGGAGKAAPLSPEAQLLRHEALRDVLNAGFAVLKNGGGALDAVTAAVAALEDCPFFNAARGAVIAADGGIELDASVMDGTSGKAGGVSAVKTIRNPVLAARAVMERTPHTLLCGEGADRFAADSGLAVASTDYFRTPERVQDWERQRGGRVFDAASALGTVGAAAIDAEGNLAAATSTGGLTNKMNGRVSDSSIPGAGTWARNGVCALSCTGTGDIFIRNSTAFDVGALMQYRALPFDLAVRTALDKVKDAGGTGGIVGIGAAGQIVMDFNTPGMNRGFIAAGNPDPQTFII
jgi:beta-aspartyl-peptidase (threonine type)